VTPEGAAMRKLFPHFSVPLNSSKKIVSQFRRTSNQYANMPVVVIATLYATERPVNRKSPGRQRPPKMEIVIVARLNLLEGN
jgi:hypothetical protein